MKTRADLHILYSITDITYCSKPVSLLENVDKACFLPLKFTTGMK